MFCVQGAGDGGSGASSAVSSASMAASRRDRLRQQAMRGRGRGRGHSVGVRSNMHMEVHSPSHSHTSAVMGASSSSSFQPCVLLPLPVVPCTSQLPRCCALMTLLPSCVLFLSFGGFSCLHSSTPVLFWLCVCVCVCLPRPSCGASPQDIWRGGSIFFSWGCQLL